MDITIENILLIGSILLFISILAGKTSFRVGVPTLVFFLIVGMLAGSEGIGKINFNNPEIAQFIGIVALNFILFSGGFETDWKSVKPVFGLSLTLSILGVLMTAAFLGFFVWWVTDFSLFEGLLLGAIVSSLTSVLIQGTSIPKVAKWLHVSLPANVKSVTAADTLLSESINSEMVEITILPDTFAAGMKIVDLRFPQHVRIALLKRGETYIIPDGSTIIESGDVLFDLAGNKEILGYVTGRLVEARSQSN